MRLRIFSALVAFLIPVAAGAADINGHSRTYLRAFETVDSDNVVGLYEYLDLSITGIKGTNLSFHAGGWGRVDLADETTDGDTEGDVQYAHLTARWDELHAVVHAGRIYVMEGIASEQVDGIYAATDLAYGLAVSAYGGNAVEANGEAIYGGRLSHGVKDLYRAGVSYLFEDYRGEDREEAGYDFALFPLKRVSLQGRASYNIETDGWMEHLYYLRVGVVERLKVRAEFSFADYDNLFSATSLSAFTVPTVDPGEELTAYGLEAEYTVLDGLAVTVDYKYHDYDIAGEAHYYGGMLTYTIGAQDAGAAVSYHRMDGETDRLEYDEIRAYAYKTWEKANVAVDFIDVIYEEDRNGVDSVYSVSLAAGYKFTPALKLGADVEYLRTPDFDDNVKGFMKLLYVFGKSWGGV